MGFDGDFSTPFSRISSWGLEIQLYLERFDKKRKSRKEMLVYLGRGEKVKKGQSR